MKKNFFLFLASFVTALATNAQVAELTTYRGAFAPAPTRMWTEGWSNWDPQNAGYLPTTTTVGGSAPLGVHITTNTTWTSNNVYLLQGLVYVDSLVTLTIEPGTVIRGDNTVANSSLIIRRGGKLNAEGTVCNPIVFTSNKAPTFRAPGDWGGIILLGRAKHNLGTQNLIEGLTASDLSNYHGGTDNEDNSGVLKYLRIEFGGYVLALNNEINGLTMGSVGRGTTIDYVQNSFINDDAFEWFGGNVNCKHLVAYRCLDDDFDTDNGFSGTVQFALGVKDPNISDAPAVSTSEGFESDNDAAGTNQTLQPKTSAYFYNVTQIGAFRCASNTDGSGVQPPAIGFRRGARIRRNSDLKIINSILMNNWRGLFVDGALALANVDQDSLVFRNNIIAGDFTSTWTTPYNASKSLAFEDANTRAKFSPIATNIYGNDSVNTCSLLVNAWNFTNPDYRPSLTGLAVDPTNLSTGADIFPFIDIVNSIFNANEAKDFMVTVNEAGGGATNGIITIAIPKLSGYDITVPGTSLTGTPTQGTNASSTVNGVPNENGNWLFSQNATTVFATSRPGVIIAKGAVANVGFRATRKASLTFGTNQTLSLEVSGGNDVNTGNNGTNIGFGTGN